MGYCSQGLHRPTPLGPLLERRVHLLPGRTQEGLAWHRKGGSRFHGDTLGPGGGSALAPGARGHLRPVRIYRVSLYPCFLVRLYCTIILLLYPW